jgi:hypothetical protein
MRSQSGGDGAGYSGKAPNKYMISVSSPGRRPGYLGRRNVAIGLGFWGLVLFNVILHVASAVVARDYNADLLSGLFLFVPLSAWVICACGIRGPYSGKVAGLAFGAGILTHVFLTGGYGLLKIGGDRRRGTTGLFRRARFQTDLFAALGSRFVKLDPLRPKAARWL